MDSNTNRLSGSSDPRTAAQVPPVFGTFAVLSKLGEGGMGAVYLAEDTRLRRRVAIKTMRPELASDAKNRDRFEREARAAAVEHDHIVPILHVGEADDGTPFIVMPFLKGEPLDARLRREPVSPLWLLLKVAREVAEGLAAAHAVGLIHRDIKPANIWLEGDPASPNPAVQVKRCKLLDFGLARSMSEDDIQLTKTGAVLGTPAYMAPEQARGAKMDHRTDLYSLGATLYRMAAGELPFSAPNTMALLYALANEVPRPLRELNPQVPAGVAGMIERLMQKAPDNRPRSAADVVVAFRRFDEREQSRSQPPVVVTALPPASEPAPLPLPLPTPVRREPPAPSGDTLPAAEPPTPRPPNRTAQKAKPRLPAEPVEEPDDIEPASGPLSRRRLVLGAVLAAAAIFSVSLVVTVIASGGKSDQAKKDDPPAKKDEPKPTMPVPSYVPPKKIDKKDQPDDAEPKKDDRTPEPPKPKSKPWAPEQMTFVSAVGDPVRYSQPSARPPRATPNEAAAKVRVTGYKMADRLPQLRLWH